MKEMQHFLSYIAITLTWFMYSGPRVVTQNQKFIVGGFELELQGGSKDDSTYVKIL